MKTVRFDPHVHSAGSYDASTPVEEVLLAARAADLDAVAVTDHDAIDESLRAVELAPEFDLLAVPGVEVSTAHGHLLALGVRARPPSLGPLAETVAAVRAQGGVAIVPHPFERSRHGVRKRHVVDCDGLETRNACSLTSVRGRQAERFAADRGYSQLGGSDAHSASMVGQAHTELRVPDDELTVETVLAAVRCGATKPGGLGRMPVRGYVSKYSTNARVKTSRVGTGVRPSLPSVPVPGVFASLAHRW